MISFLTGKVILKTEKYLIAAVNDVGYKVFCGEKAMAALPAVGGEIKLFTYLAVRETEWNLFGFLTHAELELFELLISISGIGPKTAAGILSGASVDDLEEAIVLGDETILARVSGIGKKMAQKIVLELKSKIKKLSGGSGEKFSVADEIEIIDALVALGYKIGEAREAVKQVPIEIKGIEKRVGEALKRLGRK